MLDTYKQKVMTFYERHKRMPSYQEMMTLFSFKSKNAVAKVIDKLVEAGIVEKDDRGRLSPVSLTVELPFLGLVEAGFPTLAGQVHEETVSIDEYLVKDKDSSYLLEVKGDSMIEAGIHEGDLVLAEKTNRLPKEGEIVIAEVDGGWTMKYYRKKGNVVFLEPANKKYKPIYPDYSLSIAAIVKGVIRKY